MSTWDMQGGAGAEQGHGSTASPLIREVMAHLPCGLAVFDAERRLLMHNAEFERLLNVPAALFEEPSLRFDDLISFFAARGDYGQGDAARATVEAALALGRGSQANRLETYRSGGRLIEVTGRSDDLHLVAELEAQAGHSGHLEVGARHAGNRYAKALVEVEFADRFAENVAGGDDDAAIG